jgi:hypothetical protein
VHRSSAYFQPPTPENPIPGNLTPAFSDGPELQRPFPRYNENSSRGVRLIHGQHKLRAITGASDCSYKFSIAEETGSIKPRFIASLFRRKCGTMQAGFDSGLFSDTAPKIEGQDILSILSGPSSF